MCGEIRGHASGYECPCVRSDTQASSPSLRERLWPPWPGWGRCWLFSAEWYALVRSRAALERKVKEGSWR